MEAVSIIGSIDAYITSIINKRKKGTVTIYRKSLSMFTEALNNHGINPSVTSVSLVSVEWVKFYIESLANLAPSTIYVNLFAVKAWYSFIAKRFDVSVDLLHLNELIKKNRPKYVFITTRKPNIGEVTKIVDFCANKDISEIKEPIEKLNFLRARAIIFTLANTGIDLNDLSNLRIGDIVFEKNIILITKGNNRQSLSVPSHTLSAIKEYIDFRSQLLGRTSLTINQEPLFLRHDKEIGKQVDPLWPRSLNRIIKKYSADALQDPLAFRRITPSSFKYYYENTLSKSVLDILHPKVKERCEFLLINGKFEEAIFNAMKLVEELIRSKTRSDPTDIGAALISKTMTGNLPKLVFSSVKDEQESAFFLYRGAIGVFKNPSSHRFVNHSSYPKTLECLMFASLLLRMLDEI